MSNSRKSSQHGTAKSISQLPHNIQKIHNAEHVTNKSILHTQSHSSADAYGSYGIDQLFSIDEFIKHLHIEIIELDDNELICDIIGIEAPIANALRRIMLSEVPTMALETIILFQNTSIIQDEVLTHRLGLIPINAPPAIFQLVKQSKTTPKINERNTLVFTLNKTCTRNASCSDPNASDSEKYHNHIVYSRDLQWVPQGRQAKYFNENNNNVIKPVYGDIIIAKLRPGQSIEAECRAELGIGRDHAKWSPVATASYRLLPEIIIHNAILDEDAKKLKSVCPMNVFDIEDITINGVTHQQGVVARPRNCSMCRECIRGDEPWQTNNNIELRRVRNHFIFSIESVGQYKPQDILRKSLNILSNKSQQLKLQLELAKNNNINKNTLTYNNQSADTTNDDGKNNVAYDVSGDDVDMTENELADDGRAVSSPDDDDDAQ